MTPMVVLQFYLVTTSVFSLVGRTLRRSRETSRDVEKSSLLPLRSLFFRLLKEWQQSGVIARSPEDSSVNAEDSSADAKTLQQAPLRQDGLERQRSEHFFTRRSPFMRSG